MPGLTLDYSILQVVVVEVARGKRGVTEGKLTVLIAFCLNDTGGRKEDKRGAGHVLTWMVGIIDAVRHRCCPSTWLEIGKPSNITVLS